MTDLQKKAAEFAQNVWNHADDAFQSAFDERRHLSKEELDFLKKLTTALENNTPADDILSYLRNIFLGDDGKSLELLLQLCGLTRNKVLQDLKGSVGANRHGLSFSSYKSLYSNANTWKLAGPYLLKKISKIFVFSASISQESRIFEALNQATWSGYIRQERAKRSGHEAEYRMATLLSTLGIPFSPREKADNPMCKDIQIESVSFDLVIPDEENPKICIKSTVHTANIGQYGESKDHLEMDEARRMIDLRPKNKRPLLVAFIDGVGFESNRAGLHGVLTKSDYFVQFNTIWKLAVLAASAVGKKCQLHLSDESKRNHTEFLNDFSDNLTLADLSKSKEAVQAGEALILIS